MISKKFKISLHRNHVEVHRDTPRIRIRDMITNTDTVSEEAGYVLMTFQCSNQVKDPCSAKNADELNPDVEDITNVNDDAIS